MFDFEAVSSPLRDELIDNFYKPQANPRYDSVWLLQNLSDSEMTITIEHTGLKSDIAISDFVNQNPAVFMDDEGVITTKLKPFPKVSTMRLDLSTDLTKIIAGLPFADLVLDPTEYSLETNGITLEVTLSEFATSGLIPIAFVDQSYQLDRLNAIAHPTDTLITVGDQRFAKDIISSSLYVDEFSNRSILLFFLEVKTHGRRFVINDQVTSVQGRLMLPSQGTMMLGWGGINTPNDNFINSNLVSFNTNLISQAPEITCADALDYVGVWESDVDIPLAIQTYGLDDIDTVSETDFITAMEGLNIEVTPLTLWEPTDQ